jgi:hypothetical protein
MADTWIGGRKLRDSDGTKSNEVNVDGAGGNFLINNVAVSASALQLNGAAGREAAGIVLTVGAEAANVVNVAGAVVDSAGDAVSGVHPVLVVLTSDAAGSTWDTANADFAVGSAGMMLVELVEDSAMLVLTEADGTFDVDTVTGATADDAYFVFAAVGSVVSVSGIVQHVDNS